MELVEIRCPFKTQSYKPELGLVICNRVCAKVYPGSSGEGFCHSCKLSFEYQVNEQSVTNKSIKVKSTKTKAKK